MPIVESSAKRSIDMDASTGGRSFTTAAQLVEPVVGGERLWSVVVDGAARLGVMCVTMPTVDDEARALADSLGGGDRGAARNPRPVHRRLHDAAPDREIHFGGGDAVGPAAAVEPGQREGVGRRADPARIRGRR